MFWVFVALQCDVYIIPVFVLDDLPLPKNVMGLQDHGSRGAKTGARVIRRCGKEVCVVGTPRIRTVGRRLVDAVD